MANNRPRLLQSIEIIHRSQGLLDWPSRRRECFSNRLQRISAYEACIITEQCFEWTQPQERNSLGESGHSQFSTGSVSTAVDSAPAPLGKLIRDILATPTTEIGSSAEPANKSTGVRIVTLFGAALCKGTTTSFTCNDYLYRTIRRIGQSKVDSQRSTYSTDQSPLFADAKRNSPKVLCEPSGRDIRCLMLLFRVSRYAGRNLSLANWRSDNKTESIK